MAAAQPLEPSLVTAGALNSGMWAGMMSQLGRWVELGSSGTWLMLAVVYWPKLLLHWIMLGLPVQADLADLLVVQMQMMLQVL